MTWIIVTVMMCPVQPMCTSLNLKHGDTGLHRLKVEVVCTAVDTVEFQLRGAWIWRIQHKEIKLL
jgi:hypothetical protein